MSTTKHASPASFEGTLRDMWETRPVRPRSGGKVGGVATAIGLRYGVDPILVRVAFVLAALYGGAGLVLYLLGWLLFPKEGDPVPGRPKPPPEPTSSTLAVFLVVLLIPSVFWLATSPSIIGLAVGLGAYYLLHHAYGDRGTPSTATAAAPADATTEVRPDAAPTEQLATRTPPSWDPLGAAPFAWDLPEPSDPEPPEPDRATHRWLTWATLVLAAFAGGLTSSLGAPLHISLAFALGVVGMGMVAGAFLRSGRGLFVAAVPLAAVAVLASTAPEDVDVVDDALDERTVRPATAEELDPDYELSAGTITLDLRELQLVEDEAVSTAATVGAGDIVVRLPEGVDTTASCHAEMGDVRCLGPSVEGTVDRVTTDLGADGPGGGQLVLDLRVGMGSVEVTRG